MTLLFHSKRDWRGVADGHRYVAGVARHSDGMVAWLAWVCGSAHMLSILRSSIDTKGRQSH
jgi:hypothetical protein